MSDIGFVCLTIPRGAVLTAREADEYGESHQIGDDGLPICGIVLAAPLRDECLIDYEWITCSMCWAVGGHGD